MFFMRFVGTITDTYGQLISDTAAQLIIGNALKNNQWVYFGRE